MDRGHAGARRAGGGGTGRSARRVSNFSVMKRFVLGAAIAALVGVCTGACDDSSAGWYPSGGGAGNCSAYTTCGTCTPVQGCGWCWNAYGGGCASDPDQCANVSEFTWTWDPTGCPDVDASVGHADGGAPESATADSGSHESAAPEAAQPDTGSPESSTPEASAPDGGTD